MQATELLQAQFQTMHQFMDMTIADCTPDVLEKREAGWTISRIGAIYAHVYLSEDMMVNGMAQDGTPIIMSDGWPEKLGIAKPSTLHDVHLGDQSIDLGAFREYAKVVGEATEEFLSHAAEDQLSREFDGPGGKQTVLAFLANIGLTHVAGHWGEIAALKGVQGLKGLPF